LTTTTSTSCLLPEGNPTSENIARFLYGELSRKLNADGVKVSRVKVSETPAAGVCYWEE